MLPLFHAVVKFCSTNRLLFYLDEEIENCIFYSMPRCTDSLYSSIKGLPISKTEKEMEMMSCGVESNYFISLQYFFI